MAITIDAVFENGVFVPAQRPALAENERVRLTVEPVGVGAGSAGRTDPVEWRRRHRIALDPRLAEDIARSPEFLPEES
jgi:predicted DNA-binding antitoxin AbrB/MazE fold protein